MEPRFEVDSGALLQPSLRTFLYPAGFRVPWQRQPQTIAGVWGQRIPLVAQGTAAIQVQRDGYAEVGDSAAVPPLFGLEGEQFQPFAARTKLVADPGRLLRDGFFDLALAGPGGSLDEQSRVAHHQADRSS